MLPDTQYTALYALACGMTAGRGVGEVAQYLPPRHATGEVDPGDLVAAMERTPGRVAFVSGNDELQQILAYPFAAWRIFLHPSQRKLAYGNLFRPGAGHGRRGDGQDRHRSASRRFPGPTAGESAPTPRPHSAYGPRSC